VKVLIALSNGITSLHVVVASARIVGWGINEAVIFLYLVSCPSSLMFSVKTQESKLDGYHQWPESPLMKQLALCFL